MGSDDVQAGGVQAEKEEAVAVGGQNVDPNAATLPPLAVAGAVGKGSGADDQEARGLSKPLQQTAGSNAQGARKGRQAAQRSGRLITSLQKPTPKAAAPGDISEDSGHEGVAPALIGGAVGGEEGSAGAEGGEAVMDEGQVGGAAGGLSDTGCAMDVDGPGDAPFLPAPEAQRDPDPAAKKGPAKKPKAKEKPGPEVKAASKKVPEAAKKAPAPEAAKKAPAPEAATKKPASGKRRLGIKAAAEEAAAEAAAEEAATATAGDGDGDGKEVEDAAGRPAKRAKVCSTSEPAPPAPAHGAPATVAEVRRGGARAAAATAAAAPSPAVPVTAVGQQEGERGKRKRAAGVEGVEGGAEDAAAAAAAAAAVACGKGGKPASKHRGKQAAAGERQGQWVRALGRGAQAIAGTGDCMGRR